MLDNIYKSEQIENNHQNDDSPIFKHKDKQTKKRGRLFFYLKSGMILHNSEDIRFHTYTTSGQAKEDVAYSFKKLVQDIRRHTPQDMVDGGYCTSKTFSWAYSYRYQKDVDEPLKFEYAGCKTSEGNGVVHVLTAGDYIPVKYLREKWIEYHDTPQLKVVLVKPGSHLEKTVGYLLQQYIAGQDHYERLLVSRHWLYPGARRQFLELIKTNKALFGTQAGFLIAINDWERSLWLHYEAHYKTDSLRDEQLIKKHRRIHKEKMNGRKERDYYVKDEDLGRLLGGRRGRLTGQLDRRRVGS